MFLFPIGISLLHIFRNLFSETDQIEGDQGEGNKDDGDKTDKTTIIAATKLSMAYVNPGLGLSKYKPAYDIELDDDDESNK